MNIGSELLMVLIHLVIFLFAGDDMTQRMSDTQRKNVGWVVIILCGLLVAYNALFIFAQQVLAFWKGLKLLINFLCKRKQKKKAKTKRKYSKTIKSFAPSHTATAQITKQRVKSEIKKLYNRPVGVIAPDDTKTVLTVIPRLRNRKHRFDLNNLFQQ